MASTSLTYSPILSPIPCSRTRTIKANRNTRVCTKIYAMRGEAHNHDCYSGRLVDENLIVLRRRIHETKIMEGDYEPPPEWMGWEKKFYASYDSIICDAMGWLQLCLMESRPIMALAMIALIILSVPTSTGIVMFHLLKLIRGV